MAVALRQSRRFDASSPVTRYWLANCVGFSLSGGGHGTVERFFPSFIRRFRSWSDVSAASIEDLGEVLRPIGLWRRRAGGLKALASEMVRRRGSFPIDRRQIEALPAVGQYVASAVLLFAHGRPEPLLDANMARVLERLFG